MYQYHSHCWYHLLIHAHSHPPLTAGTMDPQKCLLHPDLKSSIIPNT